MEKAAARRQISAPMLPTPTTPIVQSARCRCRAVDVADVAGTGFKPRPRRFAADRLPAALGLVAEISRQIPGEAENVTHDVVGNHVVEQAPHVAQSAGMLDQRGKQVVLQACGWRLHPLQSVGSLQKFRCHFPEECVRFPNLLQSVLGAVRVDNLQVSRDGT